jgi:hypothetical protein
MNPPYAVQQLQHVVPDAQDAVDLSTVMCHMYFMQDALPNCPVITRLTDLADRLATQRACRLWFDVCAKSVSSPQCNAKAAVRRCKRHFEDFVVRAERVPLSQSRG